MWLISNGKSKFPDVVSILMKEMVTVLSGIPALENRQYFNGIAMKITASKFLLKRLQRRYFSGKTAYRRFLLMRRI